MRYVANILDPIQDELDQRVFDGIEPRMSIFENVLSGVRSTFRDFGFNPMAFHFYLTGSLCTYQYSPLSDCDISITCRTEFSDYDRSDLVAIVVSYLDGVKFPGTSYRMQYFVQPEDIDIFDLFRIGNKAAYDLNKSEWIVEPSRGNLVDIESEYPDWFAEAIQISDKINTLLDYYHDDEAIEMYYEAKKKRQEAHRSGQGDISSANVIYKFLDNNGTFERLINRGVRIARDS